MRWLSSGGLAVTSYRADLSTVFYRFSPLVHSSQLFTLVPSYVPAHDAQALRSPWQALADCHTLGILWFRCGK